MHGHKGNVKQAIAMSGYLMRFKHLRYDIFSVDYNEGAVGLSYELLMAEAEYLKNCMNVILKLTNRDIGLIGHSMGGIVASLALNFPDAPVNRIYYMLALSTPFKFAPILTYIELA